MIINCHGKQFIILYRRDPVQEAIKCVGGAGIEVAKVLQQQLLVGVADQQQQLPVGMADQQQQLPVGMADQQQIMGGAAKASNPLEL